MHKLIIDTEFQKYQPQFNFSKILDIESVNVNKFDKVYLFIDELPVFYNNYERFSEEKVIFLFNRNIILRDSEKLDISIVNSQPEEIDVKDMIIKNKYIKDYLNGVKGEGV